MLNFVGYCDLASFQKVNPENEKWWPENTGQPKSARAFWLSSRMENENFSFSIGLDNKKSLALFVENVKLELNTETRNHGDFHI